MSLTWSLARLVVLSAAIALASWQWGWRGGVVAFAVGVVTNWTIWLAADDRALDPASARRFVRGVGWFAAAIVVLLYGGGAVFFFFVLPAALLHQHGEGWILAVPLALAIGSVLTTVTVVGVRRGWITLGDD